MPVATSREISIRNLGPGAGWRGTAGDGLSVFQWRRCLVCADAGQPGTVDGRGCDVLSGHVLVLQAGPVVQFHNAGAVQLRTIVTPEGFVGIVAGTGTVLGLSAQALHTGIFYYLETSVLSHPSGGRGDHSCGWRRVAAPHRGQYAAKRWRAPQSDCAGRHGVGGLSALTARRSVYL